MFPLWIEIFPSFDEMEFSRYLAAEDRRSAAALFSLQAAVLSVLPMESARVFEGLSGSEGTGARSGRCANGENSPACGCASGR